MVLMVPFLGNLSRLGVSEVSFGWHPSESPDPAAEDAQTSKVPIKNVWAPSGLAQAMRPDGKRESRSESGIQ
jgi:hypothetical protein